MTRSFPIRIVISGGIGSGKSKVGEILTQRGMVVIDADQVGRSLLEPGNPIAEQVADRWPETVVEGRVDRSRLGRIVFADPGLLSELESITHPAIRSSLHEEVSRAGQSAVAVEIPLLVDLLGPGWLRVVVDAPEDVRRGRLVARGMERADAERRMSVQPSRSEWLAAADYVIRNTGSPQLLVQAVDRLVEWLHA